MELNSLAKMERRGEKRRGCLGRELAAKLCGKKIKALREVKKCAPSHTASQSGARN